MYLITLYFDEKTSEELSRLIQLVEKKTGNDFMTENHVPPHMTVGAFEAPDEDTAKSLFEKMKFSGGEIQLVSVGAFLPYVVYVGAVYNEYLHEVSSRIDQVLCREEGILIRPNYRPFSWLPHVTIGKKLTKEQMQEGFRVLQENFQVLKGCVVRIGLSKTNPYGDLDMKEELS